MATCPGMSDPTPISSSRWPPILIILVLICTLVELVLQGADRGVWGSQLWRPVTYQFGAFWPGLLANWRPNYDAQPYLMFVSYAFLHGGFIHLVVNMITMVSLGSVVISRVGQAGFLVIYAGSTVIGAAAFVWLANSGFRPMVGASGALFGLAAALIVWNTAYTIRQRPGILVASAAILWPISILVLLNILMYAGTDGNVAWETHLGGFVAGAVLALFFTPRDDFGE